MTKKDEEKKLMERKERALNEPVDASGSEICQRPAKWLGRIRYAARALRDPSVRRCQVRFSASPFAPNLAPTGPDCY
jgi:hypothetical protein